MLICKKIVLWIRIGLRSRRANQCRSIRIWIRTSDYDNVSILKLTQPVDQISQIRFRT